ncbi:GNAT family N-acetyltransferase [Aquibacillus salsiterrae]|uniref:GNAT family N-acetyltransferase n=1 Tax=Aquibacillus salsiterrae TaxID=2950439 RepID=A0A9X3WD50_9BACI|nr:GNAT family N-acetyltransferase [Aquibacillus salsiterrae]MDC3416508.1 GNAT family N-acetyltransferase [Aquibacillus salsiterrae]
MRREIRTIGQSGYNECMRLGEYAFQYKLSEHDTLDGKLEMEKQLLLGSYVDNQLAAKLHILPLELFLGNRTITFGGVAGVATWPEYRRQGHVDSLIKHALVEMKKNDMAVSMLAPFSIDFYRKFGYELSHYKDRVKLKPSDIGQANGNGSCRRVSFQQAKETLQQLYERIAKQYSLMMKREDWWWDKRVLTKDDTIIVYYNQEKNPTGYLIAKMQDRVLYINEFIYLSEDAFLGMLEWIKNHDSMTEQVEIVLMPNDHLAFYLKNPKISMSKESYFMTRIVDVESLLKQYPYYTAKEEKVIQLTVTDSIAEWNEGNWTLTLKNGELADLVRTKDEKASVKISTDIQSLSAWLFQSESLERLQFFGKIHVEGSTEDIKCAIKPLKPALLDFF